VNTWWFFRDQNPLSADGVNFDFGKSLAVSVFLAVTFATFFLKNDHFVALNVAKNAGFDADAIDVGRADLYATAVVDQMYGVESDGITFVGCQPVDEDLLTLLNFELLTGDGNDCKHVENRIL